jgi:hypothetical protein
MAVLLCQHTSIESERVKLRGMGFFARLVVGRKMEDTCTYSYYILVLV